MFTKICFIILIIEPSLIVLHKIADGNQKFIFVKQLFQFIKSWEINNSSPVIKSLGFMTRMQKVRYFRIVLIYIVRM